MKAADDPEPGNLPIDLPSTQVLLAGLLALQIQSIRAEKDATERPHPEVTLADMGMTIWQIATVSGRNYEAVKSTLRRARLKSTGKGAAAQKGE